jgi:N-acetylglucosamine transport system substrate-binding protein
VNHDLITLIRDEASGRYSRRQIMQRAAALSLSAPAVAALFAGTIPVRVLAQEADNPLGVDPTAPLDVVIFKGGFGDEYAIYVNENMYGALYPDAEITYAGIQRLAEQLQPRFVGGTPPDVIDNSGAGALDEAALVAEGQLADLADLMAAPAYDTEGVTFAETLVPGSQESGIFEGTQYLLNWALSAYGIWYSSTYMDENGYDYPQTWDEMLALCAEISASGVAPWVTTGVHPQYVRQFVFDQMVWKNDPQAILNIDNLAPDAWRAPAVTAALEALYQLAEGGYLLQGWEGLDHIQSQNEWLQGRSSSPAAPGSKTRCRTPSPKTSTWYWRRRRHCPAINCRSRASSPVAANRTWFPRRAPTSRAARSGCGSSFPRRAAETSPN